MSSWFKRLIAKKKPQNRAVLGVSLTPRGAGWCALDLAGGDPLLTASAVVDGQFRSPVEAFDALCQQQSPPALPCHISLSHEFYNLLLVDAPNVPDAELSEAVRWRVKDLIAQPIEKMVVDVFRLPADAYRGRMNMLYAALLEKAVVIALAAACERQNLTLENVGIAELALASVTRQLPGVENLGLAVLHMTGNSGSINLVENGYLYLTRTLELNTGGGYSASPDPQNDPTDNLALDIQRSLDYYESQLGKSGVNRLYVVTGSSAQQQWCESLTQRLPIRAHLVGLADLMPSAQSLDALQQGLLMPAVGAALGGWHGRA
ncbi:MAG TPA: hypothetical protein VM553_16430 [Dongiaceae bacterium]|nr:hypothetical protein [Dongiaceae bacterium]